MALVIRKTTYRAWPVTVRLLECDSKGVVTEVESTFVAHFKSFAEAEYADLCTEIDAKYPPPEGGGKLPLAQALARNAELFGRLIDGWGVEVVDEAGTSLPYSTDALQALVTGEHGLAVSVGLWSAVNELRTGTAPLKNFKPSVAPGESAVAEGEAKTSSPPT